MSNLVWRRTITSLGAINVGDTYRIAPHSDYFIRGATEARVVGFANTRRPDSDGHYPVFARVILSNCLGDITPRRRRWIKLHELLERVA